MYHNYYVLMLFHLEVFKHNNNNHVTKTIVQMLNCKHVKHTKFNDINFYKQVDFSFVCIVYTSYWMYVMCIYM